MDIRVSCGKAMFDFGGGEVVGLGSKMEGYLS